METANSVPVLPRQHLYCFVGLKHHGQVRKYTGEPYFNHLRAVAEMADGKCKFGYEIGLCHDLFEDTDCTRQELWNALKRFGYDEINCHRIVSFVDDLTDEYTPEQFPKTNRLHRKTFEANRLHKISPDAQTVKYCDIINNSESILQHDPGFAKKYIPEMKMVLEGMNKGNQELYKLALQSVTINQTV